MSEVDENFSSEERDMVVLFDRTAKALEATEKRLSQPEADRTELYAKAADKIFEKNMHLMGAATELFDKSNKKLSQTTTTLNQTADALTQATNSHSQLIANGMEATQILRKVSEDLKPSRWWLKRAVIGLGGLLVGLITAGSFSWYTISNNMNPYMCSGLNSIIETNINTGIQGCFIKLKQQVKEPI